MSIERYRITPIGKVDQGNGSDEYVLVCDLSDDIDLDDVEREFTEHCYRDTDTPGAYFCHRVTVVGLDSDNECIVIVHHRYDV